MHIPYGHFLANGIFFEKNLPSNQDRKLFYDENYFHLFNFCIFFA